MALPSARAVIPVNISSPGPPIRKDQSGVPVEDILVMSPSKLEAAAFCFARPATSIVPSDIDLTAWASVGPAPENSVTQTGTQVAWADTWEDMPWIRNAKRSRAGLGAGISQ